MVRGLFWLLEDLMWRLKCSYAFWLHGPYGLAKVIEKMPFRFLIKYLRDYGAEIGNGCVIERGINLHRPTTDPPFGNLSIGNKVYLGHSVLIDLSDKVLIEDDVAIGANCQIWTHTGYYQPGDNKGLTYKEETRGVIIKNTVIVYSGVIIKHGISIGEKAEIGAGSVILRDIPAFCFAAGSPAKVKCDSIAKDTE